MIFIGTAITTLGGIVAIIGAIGLLRLPDLYTRVHAQTIITVGGAVVALVGLAIRAWSLEYSLKILVIVIILLVTSPTSTHAILRAAHKAGIKPWEGRR